jgi:hypothetical protein
MPRKPAARPISTSDWASALIAKGGPRAAAGRLAEMSESVQQLMFQAGQHVTSGNLAFGADFLALALREQALAIDLAQTLARVPQRRGIA